MSDNLLVGATWSCPAQSLTVALDTLKSAGFLEAEIWAEGFHLDPRVEPDVPAVRAWLDAHPFSIRSVHLPFDRVLPDAMADDRAEAWVVLCTTTLNYAERLGAQLAVAHPVLFFDPGESHAQGVARFVLAADTIAAHARSRGIQLSLENMHTMRGATLRSVAELRDALTRMTCRAGVCLDVGHAVFNGFVDDRLVAEILDAGELLVNSHVHDSDAIGRDPHLIPGDGIVNWPSALAAHRSIDYAGRYVLEVKGGADPLANLARARRFLFRAMSMD